MWAHWWLPLCYADPMARRPHKRTAAGAARRSKRVGAGSEHHEQVRLITWVRNFYPDVLIAAVPNGAKTGAKEGARLVDEGLLKGYPDLIVDEARGEYYGLRVELKRAKANGGGSVSAPQKAVHAKLRARGYAVHVCYGAEAAFTVIEDYLALS